MNELAALGVILLLALLAGNLVKFLRIPEVTGYILAGVLLGPAGINLITHDVLQSLHVFSEVALGLILFAIGSVFELHRIRSMGRHVAILILVESILAGILRHPWPAGSRSAAGGGSPPRRNRDGDCGCFHPDGDARMQMQMDHSPRP